MQDDSITAEQRVEIDAFLADDKTIRFIECDDNWTALANFLEEHSLSINRENMIFAYESLVRDGLLELIPFRQPVELPPQPQPAPSPSPLVPTPTPSTRPFLVFRNGQPLNNQGARRL